MQWADTAKGACIVLVVLLHVSTKHALQLVDADRAARDGWIAVSEWLRPIRMPLFFVISGWFAASALRRPFREVARRKVLQPYYLYVLWLTVQTVAVDVRIRPYVESADLDGFLHALVVPTGNLWYLWALAVYFAVAALVPPTARPALCALSGLAAVVVTAVDTGLGSRPTDLVHFSAFFLLGAVAPGVVSGVAAHVTPGRTVAVSVAFAAATVTVRSHGLADVVAVTPLLDALGVCAGIALAVSTRGRLADGLAVLGRRTLPIYVMHVPLIMVWSWAARRLGWRGWFPVAEFAWIYPVVLAAAVVAVAVLLHRALLAVGAWWLFGLDRPVIAPAVDRVDGSLPSQR